MPGVAFVVNGSLVRGSGRLLTLCREAAARHGWRPEFLVTEKAEAGVSAANSAALDGIGLVVAVGGAGNGRGALPRPGVPPAPVPPATPTLLAGTLRVPGHPRAALAAALDSGGADRTI